MLIALTGIVMAAETGTTQVTAQFGQGVISVTPPDTYTWTLAKTGNNQVNIGNVNVVSTDPWNLNVRGTNDGYLASVGPSISHPVIKFVLPVSVYLNGATWGSLTGSDQLLMTSTAASQDVPVYLQQIVNVGDQTTIQNPAKITLTFTGGIL